MNLRGLLNLLALGSLGLILAGCASSPRSGQYGDGDDALSQTAVPDPNKPSMYFAGGNIQQVRGAAMGAAVTQGWEVQKAGRDSLILQRNLDDAAAENLAPGASRGPLPPVIEVRTDFFDRSGGVEVQLSAEAVTARGTSKEMRQDYTETYRNELTHSLSILQNSWHEAGPRIANALPPIGGMRDTAPTDSSAAESIANPVPDTQPSYSMIDTPDVVVEERQPSSAVNWSLPPAAAATATATAAARANTLPPKIPPVTPTTKISQAPKAAPPVKTATKVAAVPTQSLMLKPIPQTTGSTAIPAAPSKSVPIFPKAMTTAPSGKPGATTAPKTALAGTAKSPAVAATSQKSASAVPAGPKTTPKTTAPVKATTGTATKTAAATTSKAALPATKVPPTAKAPAAKVIPPTAKAPAAKVVPPTAKAPSAKVVPPTAKAGGGPTTTKTTAKASSVPKKSASATTTPSTSKTKDK